MEAMGTKIQRYGTWMYTPFWAALAAVGMQEIGVYIAFLHNRVAQYIETCPSMDFCLSAEQKLDLLTTWLVREKPALNILGIMAGHEAAEGAEDTGTEESEGEEE